MSILHFFHHSTVIPHHRHRNVQSTFEPILRWSADSTTRHWLVESAGISGFDQACSGHSRGTSDIYLIVRSDERETAKINHKQLFISAVQSEGRISRRWASAKRARLTGRQEEFTA
jgi:hypothetical protein